MNTPDLLLAAAVALLPQDPAWTPATRDREWAFPADHGPHEGYSIEWWYFTGHLHTGDPAGPRFGYQFTLFKVGLDPNPAHGDSAFRANDAVMGHVALTDIDAGEHRFSEVFYRAAPLLGGFRPPGEGPVAWSRAPAGTPGTWELAWNGDGFDLAMRDDARGLAIELSTRPTRPPLFHGSDGFSAKNGDGSSASHYYSFTRMATRGVVTRDGERLDVEGTSWMDHEFSSSQLDDQQVGWDWFSIQLDDGRDLMLYTLRDGAGRVDHQSGTLRRADGSVRTLGRHDFRVGADATWRSEASAAEYPSRWTIELPSERLSLRVTPRVADQENRSRIVDRLHYYEGAVEVRVGGEVVGRGYVELTGYGDDARLPL